MHINSEKLILNRMTWSEAFQAHIRGRFEDSAQQKAAEALGVSPSVVHYWCRGAVPRLATRERIAVWSDGAIPAAPDVPADESSPGLADSEGSIATTTPKRNVG